MIQIYPDAGLVALLKRIVKFDTTTWRLFDNPVTVTADTVLSDLTEASFGGYAQVDLAGTAFTTFGVIDHVGFLMAPPVTFNNTSASDADVYGYYVTGPNPGEFFAVANFDVQPLTILAGKSLTVIANLGDFSENQ